MYIFSRIGHWIIALSSLYFFGQSLYQWNDNSAYTMLISIIIIIYTKFIVINFMNFMPICIFSNDLFAMDGYRYKITEKNEDEILAEFDSINNKRKYVLINLIKLYGFFNFILYLRAGIKCITEGNIIRLIPMGLIYFLLEFADLYCTAIWDEWNIEDANPGILLLNY